MVEKIKVPHCDECDAILKAVLKETGKQLSVQDIQDLRNNKNPFKNDDEFEKAYFAVAKALADTLKSGPDTPAGESMQDFILGTFREVYGAYGTLPLPYLANIIYTACSCEMLPLKQTETIKTIFGETPPEK